MGITSNFGFYRKSIFNLNKAFKIFLPYNRSHEIYCKLSNVNIFYI